MALIDVLSARSTPRANKPERAVLTVLLVVTATLQACSVAGPKRSPLPQDGPNLVDVYREHIRTEGVGSPTVPLAPAGSRTPPGPREGGAISAPSPQKVAASGADTQLALSSTPSAAAIARNAVDQRFRRLPNPDLVLYVYPHLARGKYPVPGYFTVLPMYTQVEYAMPGEAPLPSPRAAPPRTAPSAAALAPQPAQPAWQPVHDRVHTASTQP